MGDVRCVVILDHAYLVPVPGQVVGQKGFGEEMLAVDLSQS